MSDIFHDREKSEEAKYKMDAEMRFKAQARRNKLLGLWAAERLGLVGSAADAYAKDVVTADFEEPGDGDVVRKVLGDFAGQGVDLPEADLRSKMQQFYAEALKQLGGQYPDALGGDHERVGG